MDETRYRLREFLDRDFPALTRIENDRHPDRQYREDEYRRWHAIHAKPPFVRRMAVVEARATEAAVAFGLVSTDIESQDPSSLLVSVAVDPDHQGQGVGRALADWCDAELASRSTTTAWCTARADRPRDLAFPGRRGFREGRRFWDSVLDLPAGGFDRLPQGAERLEREGVRFTTLAQEGPDRREVREGIHELFNEALRDEPRLGRFTPISYEVFVAFNLEGPGILPEAFFLARAGDRYVGVSNLERLVDRPDALHQIFTGTRREYRGRGIATELKRRGTEYAQTHGYRSIRTSNDSLNHPIWAINQKLGFRRQSEFVQFEKALTSPGASPRGR